MRDYFRLRARLTPYLSTAQRIGHDTGLVTVRPLYHTWPSAADAYSDSAQRQYWFGKDIWAAPITSPSAGDHGSAGLALRSVWVPPGPWIEWFSWARVEGALESGSFHQRRYSMAEMPLFSRPGTILPLHSLPLGADLLGGAANSPDDLTFWVFPVDPVELQRRMEEDEGAAGRADAAAASFSFTEFYDDDGVSVAYADGAFAWTKVTCEWFIGSHGPDAELAGDRVTCGIYPGQGRGCEC